MTRRPPARPKAAAPSKTQGKPAATPAKKAAPAAVMKPAAAAAAPAAKHSPAKRVRRVEPGLARSPARVWPD